ncbi:DNA cytosine methyltransferase [Blautia obeum]|uniref:C-5 cytosine-specific DNA methylase n=1 Tax=Blautia obeum TaxID=40520 RepID=A0A564U854_9FIRM|nr:DNA cytosine methyltransferase [Blautia obeum]VUX15675.1 C-5 cytosine-specific DNA methylase [Blautia obeum]
MENKVIILGAGIGAMTMGFENAGCSVVAAYERDRRAIELYKKNISGEINELDQLGTSNLEDVPDIDILACDFYRDLSIVGRNPQNATDINNAIQFILDYRKPKIICFFIPPACLKWEKFVQLLGNINNRGYDYKYKQIYTEQATGLPITEKRVYLVAIHRSLGDVFEFPCFDEKKMFSLEEILENKPVEEFYRKVNCNCVNGISTKDTFFCWKQNKYIESDLADTNLIKIPLVRNERVIRKITHRELARLKNLPDDYQLDTRNKAWMYRQLMYAPNTKIMEQIASEIGNTLKRNILQKSNMMREQTFAELFRRYLIAKCKNIVEEKLCDFKCNVDGKDICFELKIYNSDYAIEKNIKRACERLLRLKGDNLILVIGNVVSKEIKANCFEVYGIHIWDVKNLLWLFEEFSDIKNEFISLLTYSIDDLQLEIPEPQLFEEKQIEKRERTWEERLKNIQPGKEFFKEYEKICTEILKNILGEYLGLWAVQEHSNEELYCFDLCCKIKNGVDQDFFNTIQNYFNTKYIVFEFKNYKEKITQREIYTTEKYLYKKALRSVAIIVSREGASRNALLAAKGCLRENGKLILCLSDKDLNELIHIKEKGEQPTAEFFEAMLDDILIHLEK